MNLLRIEYATTGIGMWHTNKEDSDELLVTLLSDQKIAELPMPHDDSVYGQKGKRWYSAVPTAEMMKMWFTEQEAQEMVDLGFQVTQFDAGEWKKLEAEYIYTRESVTNWRVIDLKEIY
jgi:hypothetical protein